MSKTIPKSAVLGAADVRPDVAFWDDPARIPDLRWYRYLFLTNSKPSSHLRALARVSEVDLEGLGGGLGKLLDRIGKAVGD